MRIALVGLGFMGQTHLRSHMTVPGVELAAAVTSDVRKLTGEVTVEGNFAFEPVEVDLTRVRHYRTLEEALADETIDAVDLCVPTQHHAELTIAALRAGKHVLVEKPMAADEATAQRMLDEARRAGRVLMVGHPLRFAPAYAMTRQFVHGGRLGAVRSVELRRVADQPRWNAWMADPALSGGGAFDLLIHDIDWALHTFGAPAAVRAFGHVDVERGIDVVTAVYEYPDGGPTVTVQGGWYLPSGFPFGFDLTVLGDDAVIGLAEGGATIDVYGADGLGASSPELAPGSGFDALVAEFARCVHERRDSELCPPAESVLAVRMGQAMVASRARAGERVVI